MEALGLEHRVDIDTKNYSATDGCLTQIPKQFPFFQFEGGRSLFNIAEAWVRS